MENTKRNSCDLLKKSWNLGRRKMLTGARTATMARPFRRVNPIWLAMSPPEATAETMMRIMIATRS